MPYSFSGVVGCRKSCSKDVRVGLLCFILLLLLVSINHSGINMGIIDVDCEVYSLMDIL